MKDARARLPARSSRNYGSPSSFLDQLARQDFQPEDFEQYQQEALARWLPVAFQAKNSDSDRALIALAGVLAEKHSDPWLKEFLAALPPGDRSGAEALSAVVLANENGLYGPASQRASVRGGAFSQQKNVPGKLFVRFQEIYGIRSLMQGEKCLARADALWDELSRTNYGWLKGQVALERAQCRNFHGDLAESDSDSKVSLSVAENFRFPVMGLRVFGISASMQSQQGRCDAAWEQGIQGLKRYWQGATRETGWTSFIR